MVATTWSGWTWDRTLNLDGLPLWWEARYRTIGMFTEVEIRFDCDHNYTNRACCGTVGELFYIEDAYGDVNPGWTGAYNEKYEWYNDTVTGEGSGPYIIKGFIEQQDS